MKQHRVRSSIEELVGDAACYVANCGNRKISSSVLEPDHHKWNEIIGDRVLKSSISIWETLSGQWCKSCLLPADREPIFNRINFLFAE